MTIGTLFYNVWWHRDVWSEYLSLSDGLPHVALEPIDSSSTGPWSRDSSWRLAHEQITLDLLFSTDGPEVEQKKTKHIFSIYLFFAVGVMSRCGWLNYLTQTQKWYFITFLLTVEYYNLEHFQLNSWTNWFKTALFNNISLIEQVKTPEIRLVFQANAEEMWKDINTALHVKMYRKGLQPICLPHQSH